MNTFLTSGYSTVNSVDKFTRLTLKPPASFTSTGFINRNESFTSRIHNINALKRAKAFSINDKSKVQSTVITITLDLNKYKSSSIKDLPIGFANRIWSSNFLKLNFKTTFLQDRKEEKESLLIKTNFRFIYKTVSDLSTFVRNTIVYPNIINEDQVQLSYIFTNELYSPFSKNNTLFQWSFTEPGTYEWNPTEKDLILYSPDQPVLIQLWSAGGGGQGGRGGAGASQAPGGLAGSGGGYLEVFTVLNEISHSNTITVGKGGQGSQGVAYGSSPGPGFQGESTSAFGISIQGGANSTGIPIGNSYTNSNYIEIIDILHINGRNGKRNTYLPSNNTWDPDTGGFGAVGGNDLYRKLPEITYRPDGGSGGQGQMFGQGYNGRDGQNGKVVISIINQPRLKNNIQLISTSGLWQKPEEWNDYNQDLKVFIQMWSGSSSGTNTGSYSGSGGNGGHYLEFITTLNDLPLEEYLTVADIGGYTEGFGFTLLGKADLNEDNSAFSYINKGINPTRLVVKEGIKGISGSSNVAGTGGLGGSGSDISLHNNNGGGGTTLGGSNYKLGQPGLIRISIIQL